MASSFNLASRMQMFSLNLVLCGLILCYLWNTLMYLAILKRMTVKQMMASPHTFCSTSNSPTYTSVINVISYLSTMLMPVFPLVSALPFWTKGVNWACVVSSPSGETILVRTSLAYWQQGLLEGSGSGVIWTKGSTGLQWGCWKGGEKWKTPSWLLWNCVLSMQRETDLAGLVEEERVTLLARQEQYCPQYQSYYICEPVSPAIHSLPLLRERWERVLNYPSSRETRMGEFSSLTKMISLGRGVYYRSPFGCWSTMVTLELVCAKLKNKRNAMKPAQKMTCRKKFILVPQPLPGQRMETVSDPESKDFRNFLRNSVGLSYLWWSSSNKMAVLKGSSLSENRGTGDGCLGSKLSSQAMFSAFMGSLWYSLFTIRMPLSIVPISFILSSRSHRDTYTSSFTKMPLFHSAMANLRTLGLLLSSLSRNTLSASVNFNFLSMQGSMKSAQTMVAEEIQLRTVPMMMPTSCLAILTVWRLKLKYWLSAKLKGRKRLILNLECELRKGKVVGLSKAEMEGGSVKTVLVVMGGALRTSVSASSACRMRRKRCLDFLTQMRVVGLRNIMPQVLVLYMKREALVASTQMKKDFSFQVKAKPPMSKQPKDLTSSYAMCGLVALIVCSSSMGKLRAVRFILLLTLALGAEVALMRLSLKQKRVEVRASGYEKERDTMLGSSLLSIHKWRITDMLATTADMTMRRERSMLPLVKYLCVFARVNSQRLSAQASSFYTRICSNFDYQTTALLLLL